MEADFTSYSRAAFTAKPRRTGAFGAVILLLTVVWLAPQARAFDQDPVGLAEQTATAYWRSTPCDGEIAVQWRSTTPPPALPGTEVEAWVTFETPLGPTNFAASPSTYTDCTVYISLASWPTYDSIVETYPEFCQMMIHEYGHFEGYADSTSYPPSDLRYPLLTDANLPGVCRYDISSGTGLPSNGFPPVPEGPSAKEARAGSLRVAHGGCFEVGCLLAHAKRRHRSAR